MIILKINIVWSTSNHNKKFQKKINLKIITIMLFLIIVVFFCILISIIVYTLWLWIFKKYKLQKNNFKDSFYKKNNISIKNSNNLQEINLEEKFFLPKKIEERVDEKLNKQFEILKKDSIEYIKKLANIHETIDIINNCKNYKEFFSVFQVDEIYTNIQDQLNYLEYLKNNQRKEIQLKHRDFLYTFNLSPTVCTSTTSHTTFTTVNVRTTTN